MKLSQIDTATYYEVTIPSSGKKVKFRPFVVKEERALLLAQESEETSTLLSTLDSVVRSCMNNYSGDLTTFDIEYLFVQIRSKSVGESVEVDATCKSCEKQTAIKIDISKVEVIRKDTHSKNIKLSDSLALTMRYPSMQDLSDITEIKDATAQRLKVCASSIESVYFGDTVYHTKDGDTQEVIAFLDNRTDDEFAKIIEFIETIPTIELKTEWTCPHCGFENKNAINSIAGFF
jgi:hypothetical protein